MAAALSDRAAALRAAVDEELRLDAGEGPAAGKRPRRNCAVELRGPDAPPLVFGAPMPRRVSPVAYAALQALIAGPDDGLTSRRLDEEVCRIPRRMYSAVRLALRDLRKTHEAWARAILPPGTKGGKWRLAPL